MGGRKDILRVDQVIFNAPKVYSYQLRKVKSSKILAVLSKQNKSESNQTIVVLINDSSFAALKAAEMRAFLRFGKIYFTILQKNKEKTLANGPKDTPIQSTPQ